MTTKASSSLSSCIRLIEESLLLPTQDVRLFTKTFLLLFAHTFVSIAVAVHYAHPLATGILSDIKALKAAAGASHNNHDDRAAAVDSATWEHGKKLLLICLAYVATKLATQVAVALAASATYSGDRLTRSAVRERLLGGGLLGTAALAAVLEVSLTALPAALLVTTWTYSSSAMESLCGYMLFTAALLLHVYLGMVVPVSVAAAVTATATADGGCHGGAWALRRAWQLLRSRTRKEAAVLVFVVYLLPAVVYPAPVYAFSFAYPADKYSMFYYPYTMKQRFSLSNALLQGQDVWLLGVVSGSGLPTVGAQLFSMVTATVFCCLSMDSNGGGGCTSII